MTNWPYTYAVDLKNDNLLGYKISSLNQVNSFFLGHVSINSFGGNAFKERNNEKWLKISEWNQLVYNKLGLRCQPSNL